MSRRSRKLQVLPCNGCGAKCCHVAPFTEEEFNLAKIAYGGLPPDAEVVGGLRQRKEFGGKPTVLVVKPDSELRCAFVGDDARCTIYDARPLACRHYGRVKELPCIEVEPERARRLGGEAARALGILREEEP